MSQQEPETQSPSKPASASLKSEKDAMVVELSSLVKTIAHRMARRMPPHVDVDDLISAGMIGLLDAFDKFDTAKSNNFRKYAEVRVKGAILDEVRAMDPMGRVMRRKVNAIGKTQHELEQELGRAPTADEVAQHLGIEVEGYHALMNQLQPILVLSVEEMSDEGRDFSAWVTDRRTNDPLANLEGKRVREFLDRQIAELKEKQGLVLRFYFYDGMSLREISKILGVSESRTSQLMDEALEAFGKKVRIALSRHGGVDVGPRTTRPPSRTS